MHEQESHGLADNVAAAEDHGIRAFDRYVAAAENFHTAGRRTSDEAGTPAQEAAEIDGMEPVDIFCGINGLKDALGVNLRRQRKLDEDAVNLVIAIQVLDQCEHFVGCDG